MEIDGGAAVHGRSVTQAREQARAGVTVDSAGHHARAAYKEQRYASFVWRHATDALCRTENRKEQN
jgi:hypothetical protein